MDITKTLTQISNFRTKAIFANNQEIETQLQKLIPLALAVYEHRACPNSDEYQEKRKLFYEALEELPKGWRPFTLPADTGLE